MQVLRDEINEGNETFTVKLSNPMGDGETFAPGGDTATGTIENDDSPPTILFAPNNGSITVVEGNTGATPVLTFTGSNGAPVGTSFCSPGNDLSSTNCPCLVSDGQTADPGHGCGNSVFSGGALLTAVGTTSPDTVQLTASDIPAGVGSIYLEGSIDLTSTTGPVQFGDGIRCAGGSLIRMGLRNDTDNDSVTTLGPSSGDPQISVLGGVIAGNTYVYQTYYRNPNPAWCAPNTFNVTQAIRIAW